MQLELPGLIREHLKERGLSRRQLVERMGYRNINKGMRYLMGWLRGEELPGADQVGRLAAALDRPHDELEALVRRDTAAVIDEARRRRARDRRCYLTIRYQPAVYVTEVLGEDLDERAALEAAAARAAAIQRRCCLNAPSNRSYWLSAAGTIDCVTEGGGPTMRIGGRAFRILVDG